MLYMVQLLDDTETWDAEMAKYGPEDMKRLFAFMDEINKEITARGEWVEGRGLGGPSGALTVRAREGGAPPEVTEGPYERSGRILSGYWVIDVADRERAVELAARISGAPAAGGEPANFPVELHLIPDDPTG